MALESGAESASVHGAHTSAVDLAVSSSRKDVSLLPFKDCLLKGGMWLAPLGAALGPAGSSAGSHVSGKKGQLTSGWGPGSGSCAL